MGNVVCYASFYAHNKPIKTRNSRRIIKRFHQFIGRHRLEVARSIFFINSLLYHNQQRRQSTEMQAQCSNQSVQRQISTVQGNTRARRGYQHRWDRGLLYKDRISIETQPQSLSIRATNISTQSNKLHPLI